MKIESAYVRETLFYIMVCIIIKSYRLIKEKSRPHIFLRRCIFIGNKRTISATESILKVIVVFVHNIKPLLFLFADIECYENQKRKQRRQCYQTRIEPFNTRQNQKTTLAFLSSWHTKMMKGIHQYLWIRNWRTTKTARAILQTISIA